MALNYLKQEKKLLVNRNYITDMFSFSLQK